MKDILKYSIFAGLWAILLIPFFVANGMFFPYITGKNFAFRIIVEIIFALYLILAINYKEYRPRFSWILASVSIFTVVMLIADLFGVNPSKALWSNSERMDGFVTLIHLWGYLIVFGTVMKSEENWLWFFRTLIVSPLFFLIYKFFAFLNYILNPNTVTEFSFKNYMQYIGVPLDGSRWAGPLGNPIYLAVLLMFMFFVSLFLMYREVIRKNVKGSWYVIKFWLKDWKFYAYILIAILNFLGIWMTQTRGVILGLVGGVLVTLIIVAIWENKDSVLKRISIIKILAIVAIIIAFFVVKDASFMKKNPTLSRLAAISWSSTTGQGQARQYVWPMALKGFAEKPILGWGQDGFNYVFNKYYDARMFDQEQWFDRAHNTPLDILVAGGILGLISYLAIFVACLYVVWKSRRDLFEKALIVGLLAAYFFQNLFAFDNLVSYFLFFAVLSYIYFAENNGREEIKKIQGKNYEEMSNDLKNILAIIIICSFGFILWRVNIRPIKANFTLIKALSAQEYSIKEKKSVALTAEQTLEYFKKSLAYGTFANPEIREHLLSNSQIVAYSSTATNEAKLAHLNFALEQIIIQASTTPNDARYQIFTGSFLNNMGRSDLALPFLEKAKELSPNKQTIAFELIQGYINLGEKIKARDEAKRVYELDKSFEKPKMVYVATLIMAGEEKAGLEILGGVKSSDENITKAYLEVAVDKYEKGLLAQAVAEVNKAIDMNPSFENTGKELINQIWTKTLKY